LSPFLPGAQDLATAFTNSRLAFLISAQHAFRLDAFSKICRWLAVIFVTRNEPVSLEHTEAQPESYCQNVVEVVEG